jgi:hypothetical protein
MNVTRGAVKFATLFWDVSGNNHISYDNYFLHCVTMWKFGL